MTVRLVESSRIARERQRRESRRQERQRRRAARRAWIASRPQPHAPVYRDETRPWYERPTPPGGWCWCRDQELRANRGRCCHLERAPDGRLECTQIPF